MYLLLQADFEREAWCTLFFFLPPSLFHHLPHVATPDLPPSRRAIPANERRIALSYSVIHQTASDSHTCVTVQLRPNATENHKSVTAIECARKRLAVYSTSLQANTYWCEFTLLSIRGQAGKYCIDSPLNMISVTYKLRHAYRKITALGIGDVLL